MPSAIAIRMYWVNLLDISYPLNSAPVSLADSGPCAIRIANPQTQLRRCARRARFPFMKRAPDIMRVGVLSECRPRFGTVCSVFQPFRRSNEANPESAKLLSLSDSGVSQLRMLQIACCERALSALHQIAQQIRSHRQLGERQATGSDLLDRTADARSFRMGREPVLGGLLAGLAVCQHIRDQSSFRGCDLVNGAVDGKTLEKIVRRHAACGGDDAVETEIGLGGEEGRGRITDGAVGAPCDRNDIECGDQGVEVGEFAGEFQRDA